MVKVTFKGQLSLLMLIEEYSMLGYIELISANTDGLVIKYPSDKEEEVQRIHDEWEKITGYMLEDTYYNRIIFRDVNNYIAEIIDSKTKERVKMKYKGCFEIDPEYHKNGSNRIVPIAMMEYLINDVPVKETVQNIGREFINSKGEKERTTIFDYCEGRKSNDKVDNYSLVSGNNVTAIKDKVIRFYISNSRDKLIKVYASGKLENINKGFNHTLFMEYEEREDYNINYDFYINECRKIIDPIEIGTRKLGYKEPEQLKMF